jgi:hypothetical protein
MQRDEVVSKFSLLSRLAAVVDMMGQKEQPMIIWKHLKQ